MDPILTLAVTGLTFGLSAGVTPGPLLTLTITQTLRFGALEGVKVCFSPILTDLPIILFVLLVLSRLGGANSILGGITLLGGGYLAYLGWESLRFSGVSPIQPEVKPQSLRKGIVTNLLNPGPYLFWFTIGAPLLYKALENSLLGLVVFVGLFYGCLVGSKVVIAILVGRSRGFLKSKAYILVLRVLGLALLGYAAYYLKDGLGYLGVL